MALNRSAQSTNTEMPPPARWAGAFLLAAAMFATAAVMAFGSLGLQSPWGWAFALMAVLTLLGWFVGRRQQARLRTIARDAGAKQRSLLGLNAVASVLILLVVLVGVNYIAARRHKTFDLTKNRINSLAPQTYSALEKMPRPVKLIYVYAAPIGGQPDATDASLLNAFKNASDKVTVEYVNAQVEQLKYAGLKLSSFSGAPLLVVELQGRKSTPKPGQAPSDRREVPLIDEQNITSAVLKLTNPKPQILYFLTGHGELNPREAAAVAGMNQAAAALTMQNYTIRTLELMQAKATVPADAAAIVAVAPKVDLSPQEEKLLRQYSAARGRLVLLLNPTPTPLPRWKSLLASLGIEMLNGLVDDPVQSPQASSQILIGALDVERHPLLQGVSGHVLLPGVVPLQPTDKAPGGLNVTSLFDSSPQSQVRPFPGTSMQARRGPFVLAATIERSATDTASGGATRVVVVSNAAFATDQSISLFGNSSFLSATVNWVAGNDALVSIPPKPPLTNTIEMNDSTRAFVVLFSLFAAPVCVLILGTIVWWQRR